MKILQISNHTNTEGSQYLTFNYVFKLLSINYVVKLSPIMRFEKTIAIFLKEGESHCKIRGLSKGSTQNWYA